MILRAAARKFGNSFPRSATKRYVVTPSGSRRVKIGELLRHYPRVILLDALDDSTALVEMSERDRVRLSRRHPELAIEPNIPYRKVG